MAGREMTNTWSWYQELTTYVDNHLIKGTTGIQWAIQAENSHQIYNVLPFSHKYLLRAYHVPNQKLLPQEAPVCPWGRQLHSPSVPLPLDCSLADRVPPSLGRPPVPSKGSNQGLQTWAPPAPWPLLLCTPWSCPILGFACPRLQVHLPCLPTCNLPAHSPVHASFQAPENRALPGAQGQVQSGPQVLCPSLSREPWQAFPLPPRGAGQMAWSPDPLGVLGVPGQTGPSLTGSGGGSLLCTREAGCVVRARQANPGRQSGKLRGDSPCWQRWGTCRP